MTNDSILSRRDALQSLTLMGAALGLGQFTSCNQDSLQAHTTTSKKLSPFYLPPSAQLEMPARGITIKKLVRSDQTNVQISSIEFAVAPKQMGPAPHLHEALDELMLVLEGTATVLVGDKVQEIPAGGWHFSDREK